MADGNENKPIDFDKFFPEQIAPPPKDVFELGLVMGGTVSAGAYTAGVLDFLIEALDAWELEKSKSGNDTAIPRWQTKIQAMAGTSGGGVIAALLGRALSFKFPPVRKNSSEEQKRNNPLYRVWVDELDISDMLKLSDVAKNKRLNSILNPAPLERSRDLIANYQTSFPSNSKHQRSYIPQPLPIYLTLSNLRGIPYRVDMGGGLTQSYVDHADYVRLAAFTHGGNTPLRPDEFGASDQPGAKGFLSWTDYAGFALGTSAFPIGFPLRPLSRPLSQLSYRPIVTSDVNGQQIVKPLVPDWASMGFAGAQLQSSTYHFLTADGGMINNEPIELCRKAIAGWVGRNPRNGTEANRAILLVDPFAEAPKLGPESPLPLRSAIGSLIGLWKDQARYDSRDIMLATDSECFSRFMITAIRQGAEVGGKSIASASLGAFGGFLCKEFRHHDFLLGRANCRKYLKECLVLPKENPLFSAWLAVASPAEVEKFMVLDNERESLPLIPLFGDCLTEEQTDTYPVGAFNVYSEDFQDQLENRIDKVLDLVMNDIEPGGLLGFFARPILSIIESIGEDKLQDAATKAIQSSLKEWGLVN